MLAGELLYAGNPQIAKASASVPVQVGITAILGEDLEIVVCSVRSRDSAVLALEVELHL